MNKTCKQACVATKSISSISSSAKSSPQISSDFPDLLFLKSLLFVETSTKLSLFMSYLGRLAGTENSFSLLLSIRLNILICLSYNIQRGFSCQFLIFNENYLHDLYGQFYLFVTNKIVIWCNNFYENYILLNLHDSTNNCYEILFLCFEY